jgi:hypothetical protein
VRQKKTFLCTVLLTLLIWLLTAQIGKAFDNLAHLALSQRATQVSNLDNFLKGVLGSQLADDAFHRPIFPNGINQPIEGKKVTELIQDGVLREDSIAFSLIVKNHFHNPKQTWDQAGLWLPGTPSPIGSSSLVWGQLTNQNFLGTRSWHQAREAYYKALTATSSLERNRWFATTFRLLGHAIHLVQDGASPAHTRNDAHLSPLKFNPDEFHIWADRNSAIIKILLRPPYPPRFSIISQAVTQTTRFPLHVFLTRLQGTWARQP